MLGSTPTLVLSRASFGVVGNAIGLLGHATFVKIQTWFT